MEADEAKKGSVLVAPAAMEVDGGDDKKGAPMEDDEEAARRSKQRAAEEEEEEKSSSDEEVAPMEADEANKGSVLVSPAPMEIDGGDDKKGAPMEIDEEPARGTKRHASGELEKPKDVSLARQFVLREAK